MFKYVTLIFYTILMVANCDICTAGSRPAIIPAPAMLIAEHGQFPMTAKTAIVVNQDAGNRFAAEYLQRLVEKSDAVVLPIRSTGRGIVFQRARVGSMHHEAYTLNVTPANITITAADDAGSLYGAVTAWQLLTQIPGQFPSSVTAVHIADAPRFGWRGYMLDTARHFRSVASIKKQLDWMVLHKMNVFHWHLTDDQGWRLEIKRYPKLTSVGAWRLPTDAGAVKDIDPATGKPRLEGGFYTQDDVRTVVQYAAERQITILPEIEMPGHATAAIVAYPELASTNSPPKSVEAAWGVFPNLYNVDDSTFVFMQNVLDEVMALFPGQYIHVGGDEAVKTQWQTSQKIQAQMHVLGIKNEQALQSYFTRRIEAYLRAHKRRLIGWDEILEGGIAPGAVVMSWQGIEGAIAATKLGHDTILSPAPTLYLDNIQSGLATEGTGRAEIITLKDIFDFNPLPAAVPKSQQHHILGMQTNIWTEYVRTDERLEEMVLPRMAAVAERAWSPASDGSDWNNFTTRLATEMQRYKSIGLHPSESAYSVVGKPTYNLISSSVSISLSNQVGVGKIYYTTDGTAPSDKSILYTQPVLMKLPAVIKSVAFHNGKEITAITNASFDSATARRRSSHELETCSAKERISMEDDAPQVGSRAIFLFDILNPCWIYKSADMNSVNRVTARIGQEPVNFMVGAEKDLVIRPSPKNPDGELQVHLDTCTGPLVAELSILPAVSNAAVTSISGPINLQTGKHDLCFYFATKTQSPMWVIDTVDLNTDSVHAQ